MKRMTQVLLFGLLLSISSIALADRGHDRNGHDGHHGNRGHHAYQYDGRRDHRPRHRHDAYYYRPAPRHLHHGRYCHDWHPRGYVAPRSVYAYREPGLVIVLDPRTGLYISSGR